jgi:ABC-type transporter Mla MlaB component
MTGAPGEISGMNKPVPEEKRMSTATEEAGRTRELVLKGALVIQRVAEVKEELKKALDEVDTLMVNLVETSEMDLSCLQLLCSAHRSAVGLNKTLTRVGEADARGIFKGAGMIASPGCAFACDQECVWAGGEES